MRSFREIDAPMPYRDEFPKTVILNLKNVKQKWNSYLSLFTFLVATTKRSSGILSDMSS